MRVLCVFGQYNYGDSRRGESYEYANFIPAIKRLGHEVHFFEAWNRSAHESFAALNRRLLDTIQSTKPDVIFFVIFTYELWLESLAMMRDQCRSALVYWATDDSWKYEQCSRFIAPYVDVYATTDRAAITKAKREGIISAVETQWAADASRLKKPLHASECRYPVSFIGSAHGTRPKVIAELRRRGIEVKCFGHGWPGGPIPAEQIPQIIQESIISLNFAESPSVMPGGFSREQRQIKARTFEVPGAGGFLLTEKVDGLNRYFVPDKELVTYDGVTDLVDKITYFLAHTDERDQIALAGYTKTSIAHTYDIRFRELLEEAVQHAAERQTSPSTGNRECKFDFERFKSIEEQNHAGLLLRLLRLLILVPCIMLWGPRKGRRAARHLVFEASWRTVGARTYTARGWPGKLFYCES